VVINAAFGLGENVVQGTIEPDEFMVFKPFPSIIEKHLGKKSLKMVYTKKGTKNTPTPKKSKRSSHCLIKRFSSSQVGLRNRSPLR